MDFIQEVREGVDMFMWAVGWVMAREEEQTKGSCVGGRAPLAGSSWLGGAVPVQAEQHSMLGSCGACCLGAPVPHQVLDERCTSREGGVFD